MTPANPIEAVTRPDPSPYYDDLATRPPMWDDSLGMWVVSRAADVSMVLRHKGARVRPPDAPIPPALAGTGAGDVFGRLVRMHDRQDRESVKEAITDALGSLDDERVAAAVRVSASALTRIDGHTGRFVDRWLADVPLGAVADLIGIDEVDLPVAVEAGRAVAACFGPVPPADATAGAEHAVDVLTGLVSNAASDHSGLAADLRRALPPDRGDDAVANTIGLLFQTADATAGLCANTLVRLAEAPRTRHRNLAAAVADVAMHDPAVQNTRRWFAGPADIGEVRVAAGDAVLVVLAAANRDPAGCQSLSFGAGRHRCPAASLARRIAALTVAALLDDWPGLLRDVSATGFRAMPNARIATFG